MTDRPRFSNAELALITRVEKTGVLLEKNKHGWGFFNASDKALKLIKGIANIRFLDLFEACEAGEVSDDGLLHIVGMGDLRYVALGPGISDTGLANLGSLTELREVRLDSATDVTDHGLPALMKLSKLERLSLQYTDITDEGLGHLEGLSSPLNKSLSSRGP